jgi:hypothetical protein
MHDDADRHRPLDVAVAPSAVEVAQRHDVAEPQALEPVLSKRGRVVGLNLDRAGLAGQTRAGADQHGGHFGGHRHGDRAVLGLDLEGVEQARRDRFQLHVRCAGEPQTAANGPHEDRVPDRHALADVCVEVDDDVVGKAATLAGDRTARPGGSPLDSDRFVADAGQTAQRAVLDRSGGDRDARLDHVGDPTERGVADRDVVDDAARRGQQNGSSIGPDDVGAGRQGRTLRRADRALHRDADEL